MTAAAGVDAMTRDEAAHLKPGDQVKVEDATGARRRVMVIHATKRGGVLVEVNGGQAWLPYTLANF